VAEVCAAEPLDGVNGGNCHGCGGFVIHGPTAEIR
jgi:hypothetical protein